MTSTRSRPGRRERRSRLALGAAVLLGVTLIPAAPAAADTSGSFISPPQCQVDPGQTMCFRMTQAWRTNSADPNYLGNLGAYQSMDVYYSPVLNSEDGLVHLSATSKVFDHTKSNYSRMRLTQTFKALDVSGATVSVGWNGISLGGSDPSSVSATQVVLSMTRQAPIRNNTMSRYAALAFPENNRTERVEQVSSSTIEYPSSNRSYRLVTQARLTSY